MLVMETMPYHKSGLQQRNRGLASATVEFETEALFKRGIYSLLITASGYQSQPWS